MSMDASVQQAQRLMRSYKIAKWITIGALGVGTILTLGPLFLSTLGQWLSGAGLISKDGQLAQTLGWAPMALFVTVIPGAIAGTVGQIALVVAVVLRVRAHIALKAANATKA